MSFITDNYRFAKLATIALLTLIISSSAVVSGNEEKQVRTINKRVWSIINGKVQLDKSAYTVERVRITTPKVELIEPPPPNEKERIPADKLHSMTLSQLEYKKRKLAKKKERRTYSSSAKGSAKSFLETSQGVGKFCNTNPSSSFCAREAEAKTPYFGNTPKRHVRKTNMGERNIIYKNRESIEFVERLVKQSNY
jgi:hypothetical protein